MIEDVCLDRSAFEDALADGNTPTFGYSWGEGHDDPQLGFFIGWTDRTKKHKPFVGVDLFWRHLQIGWLFS